MRSSSTLKSIESTDVQGNAPRKVESQTRNPYLIDMPPPLEKSTIDFCKCSPASHAGTKELSLLQEISVQILLRNQKVKFPFRSAIVGLENPSTQAIGRVRASGLSRAGIERRQEAIGVIYPSYHLSSLSITIQM